MVVGEYGYYEYGYFVCSICCSPSFGHSCRVEVCRGNVARFERYKIRYGVQVVYVGAAAKVEGTGHSPISTWAEAMTDRRFWGPGLGPLRRAIRDEIDGYCIDAPDEIPAGACFWQAVPELASPTDQDPGYPAQRSVFREGD